MKEQEVPFINEKLGSRDNSEQKKHITQKISVFQSDHPYTSMSILHTGDLNKLSP